MLEYTATPFFGFTVTIITYVIATKIYGKFKTPILNPMAVASLLIIIALKVFSIPLENYMVGGQFISMLLGPATAALAVSMYRQFEVVKKNWLPILIGCTVGVISALGSTIALCHIFGISWEVTASLIPKSITTAFATPLAEQLGGIPAITVAGIFMNGIFGAVAGPSVLKLFHINDPIATGLAIGATSHAIGTAKAIEIGEIEGSVSGIAIGLCGVITVLLCVIFGG